MDGVGALIEFVGARTDELLEQTLTHARYVLAAVLSATIIGMGVAIWARHRPLAREVALGIAAVFLTIPSLALFAIFIPIVGLGFLPVYIALTMYALLPIMRNTVVGLLEVNPAVLESARGMGLSASQRLWKIELPLAWPVIITGVRVATLLTTGIAAIAVLVGAGGLGVSIQSGLRRLGFPNSFESLWAGTVLTVILALAFDFVFIFIRKATTSRGIR